MPEITDAELAAFKENETKLTDLTTNFTALKANQDKLIDEAKTAKKAKTEIEEAARIAAENKAKDDKDFESLFNSSEKARKESDEKFSTLQASTKKSFINVEALKIASALSEGSNVGLMAEFVTKRLDYADGVVKVLDASGGLTINTVEQLQEEFRNNDSYSSLVKGSAASGGNSKGNGNGDGASGDINPFDTKTHNLTKQAELLKSDPEKYNQMKAAAAS